MRNSTELRARRHYRLRGFRILGENVWIGGYELDLVVRRGRTLVFCEVKGKSGPGFGDPLEMVDAEKRRRLRRAAAAWIAAHRGARRLRCPLRRRRRARGEARARRERVLSASKRPARLPRRLGWPGGRRRSPVEPHEDPPSAGDPRLRAALGRDDRVVPRRRAVRRWRSRGRCTRSRTCRPRSRSSASRGWCRRCLLLLVGGAVSDRFERRRVLMLSDAIRGSAIAAIGILSVSGTLQLWHVIALVAVYGAGGAVFTPAFTGIIRDVVPRELLLEANSLGQFVRPLCVRLVGPAIGGVLIGVADVGTAFLVDAGTFAFSATAFLLMHTRSVPDRAARARSAGTSPRGSRTSARRRGCGRRSAPSTFSLLFFLGPVYVLMPYVVKNSLHGGAGGLGLVFAAGGVGAVAASLLRGQLGLPRRPLAVVYLAWTGTAFSLVGYAFVERRLAGDARQLLLGRVPDDRCDRLDDRAPARGAGPHDRPRLEPGLGALARADASVLCAHRPGGACARREGDAAPCRRRERRRAPARLPLRARAFARSTARKPARIRRSAVRSRCLRWRDARARRHACPRRAGAQARRRRGAHPARHSQLCDRRPGRPRRAGGEAPDPERRRVGRARVAGQSHHGQPRARAAAQGGLGLRPADRPRHPRGLAPDPGRAPPRARVDRRARARRARAARRRRAGRRRGRDARGDRQAPVPRGRGGGGGARRRRARAGSTSRARRSPTSAESASSTGSDGTAAPRSRRCRTWPRCAATSGPGGPSRSPLQGGTTCCSRARRAPARRCSRGGCRASSRCSRPPRRSR